MQALAVRGLFVLLLGAATGCASSQQDWRHAPHFCETEYESSSLPYDMRLPQKGAEEASARETPSSRPTGGKDASARAPSSRSRVREKVSARPPPVGGTLVSATTRPSPEPRQPTTAQGLQSILDSTSLSGFIEPQRKVDMPRLLEGLDPWDAALLGAKGPLRTGRDILNRKRAEAIVDFTQHWTLGRAEVFTLFIFDTAFTDDLRDVLRRLGNDKRLGTTLFLMPDVTRALQRRGIRLAD